MPLKLKMVAISNISFFTLLVIIFCHLSFAHCLLTSLLHTCTICHFAFQPAAFHLTNKYPCIHLKAFPPTVNPAGCLRISPSTHRRAVITSQVNYTEFHALHCSEKFCCHCKIKNTLCSYLILFAYVTKQQTDFYITYMSNV